MAFSKSKALLFPTPNPFFEKAMVVWIYGIMTFYPDF